MNSHMNSLCEDPHSGFLKMKSTLRARGGLGQLPHLVESYICIFVQEEQVGKSTDRENIIKRARFIFYLVSV